jgi:Tfp pilus assembly protein PilX
MCQAIRSAASDDRGIALVVVIGAIALISVFAVGGFAMASQAMHSTGRLQTEELAFQVANSGMERELASFSESNFESGQNSYTRSGSTPDGAYIVQVGFDPAVPYRYSLISSGTVDTETAMVRQDFYFFDLWSTNIAAQNNPDMGPIGSASSWNGNSTISGPFYVGGDCDFNSNVVFVGGPLFVSGNADLSGGVSFVPVPAGSKFPLFVRGSSSGVPSNVKLYNSCPKLELPWTDPDYMNQMLELARVESSDNLRGSDHLDGSTPTNDEVATPGVPTSYTGTKATGATSYYKEISGDLTITGATASFGKVTKVAGVATNWDDFAYDTDTDTLYVDGVVYVDGNVTIGAGVQNYVGSGVIVCTGNVLIRTGTEFQPVGGDSEPDDLSSEMCLEFVAQDIKLDGGTFEGIVFANGDFDIDMNGVLMGAVHAHAINSLAPHTDLYMESNMTKAILPTGTPGSPTDPRGMNYGGGVVIPGTWSRMQ